MPTIVDDIAISAEWIAKALSASGYKADFSPASLWEIDRFFDEQSVNGAAKPNGLLSQDLGSRIFSIGSYVGEVIRHNLGGEWVGDDSDPKVELEVALHLPNKVICWPIQRAMKRFKNGREDCVGDYASALGLEVGPRPVSAVAPPKKPFWKLW